MANYPYTRQGNYFSEYEVNSRIIQGNNFSGTVVESLQNASPAGPEAPDIVWESDWRASHDVVDGNRSRVSQGSPAPVPRPRVLGHSTPEVTSTQRSQEQEIQPAGPPVFISVRRRTNPLDTTGESTGLTEEEKETLLRERRAALVQEYNNLSDPALQRLLSVCSPLVNMDVDIERKYVELDIWRVFEANQEKSHFLHLPQGLGILEKYASNLIKEGRPPYWRAVKFTSSLVQVHVGRLIGSRDILSQMGYTQDIPDGVAFPTTVTEPDVDRLRHLAPDLFFARYEIDALLVNNHPFYELDPPVSRDEVQIPVLLRANFAPSRPQPFPSRMSAPSQEHQPPSSTGAPAVPAPRNTLRGNQPSRPPSSPTPAARRPGSRDLSSPPDGKGSKSTAQLSQEPQAAAERNTESEEDSEYEDAEDGILPSNGSTEVQTNFECRVCGESIATMFCKDCKDTFCGRCSELYHNHPSRQRHVRTDLVTPSAGPSSGAATAAIAVAASAAATTAPGTEQQPHRVASPIANVASAGGGSRPRPVPAPRRNKTPLPSHEGVTQSARATEPKREEPPPPLQPRAPYNASQGIQTTSTYSPMQQSPSPRSSGFAQLTAPAVASESSKLQSSVVGQPQHVISTSSQVQSQRREILRPPPLTPFNTGTQPSTLGAYDERDNQVVVKSVAAPPLPPKPSSTAKPKVPVESKAAGQEATSPERGSALSCPYCFCLNSAHAKICLFCRKPLTVKSHQEPSSHSVPTQMSNPTAARNFPPPHWALSPEQRVTAQQMQMSQGNANVMTSSGAGQASVDPDKWECEHCTYHNPRTRKICEMCCKTSSNSPQPARTDFGEQHTTPRETQNVTNMAMQFNTQQGQVVTEPAKKTDLQATPTVIPLRAAQVSQQARVWEGSATVSPANPPGPPTSSVFQGVHIPGQAGILNTSGVVSPEVPVGSSFPGAMGYSQGGIGSPGPVPEGPLRGPFMREAGLPYSPQGFPPPPPMMQSEVPMGPVVPAVGPFPAPVCNAFTQQPFIPGFPQAPPPFAAGTTFQDEAIRRHQEEIYIAGQRYVEWLRNAEREGFTAEELNIASVLGIDDPQGPIHWLRTTWYDLIHKVMVELAVPENSQEIGNITPEEVREALIECTGEVSRATMKCMEIRKKKVKELQQAGVYAKTDCVSALDAADGDTEKAILGLEKMTMRPILQRVLNSCLPDNATQDDVFLVLSRQTETQSPQDKANFEAIVTDKGQNLDRRIRAVLAEKDVSSWGRAETAIRLIDMNYSVEDSIEAARNCGDFQRSLRYLQQECPLCYEMKPMSQMVTFLHCQDRVCSVCVSHYITLTIKDKNILRLVCPVCGKPDNLDDEAVATEYFNNFDILIRGLVDQETHDLFQRKLRDRTLMKEPNFRWCSHCSSGFINEQPGQIRMMCPHCRQFTCFKCRRKWEDQHQGISCEQFAAWKEANDPEYQAAGLAAHLKMNGIVCPGCKYRYDLSKGGCMHFKCGMCPHEFCSGCYNPFLNTNAQNCPVSERCTLGGLHAHHPRDCYFYLRDRSPEELQKLLHDNNVEYNTEPPEGQGNASDSDDEAAPGAAAAAAPLRCKVNEQKETPNGLVDAECGAEVPDGHAGLCGKHYVEYLVVLVNDNCLDPADIMSSADLTCVLKRGFVDPPVKRHGMNDEQYKQLLLQTVKEQLPLPHKSPRKRILDDEDDIQLEQNIEQGFSSDEDDDDDDIIAHGGLREDPFFDEV